MEQFKQLVYQRGRVQARVSVIINKLSDAIEQNDNTNLSQLKAVPVFGKTEDQDEKLDEFDSIHTDALEKLNHLLDFFRADPTHNNRGSPQVIVTQQPLKTPIPTFDGKYEAWPKFKALFNDLVGKCGDSDATKLQYLDKALIGEASGILDARIINDNNYQQAWQLLEERLENPRVIIDTHISGLLSMKPIYKQCWKELRNLIDNCNRHVEGLRFMEQNIDGTSGLIVVKLLTSCLDGETRKQWEQTLEHGELPNFDESLKFLRNYCQVLERCEIDKTSCKLPMSVKPSWSPRAFYPGTSVLSESVCEVCAGSHLNYKCPSFLNMNVGQRVSKVKQIGLCFNCLRKGHQIRACPSDKSCSKCSKKHHTMLHYEREFYLEPESQSLNTTEESEVKTASVSAFPENPVSTACSSFQRPAKQVLLMTALVSVASKGGRESKLRALLDSGSQVNLISESAVNLLELPKYPANIPVVGVGGAKSRILHRVIMRLFSDYSGFQSDVNCLVTRKVTDKVPSVPADISEWNIPPGIVLADPKFNQPRDVDLLIGAEIFFQILKQAQLKLAEGLPSLYETEFGWVFAGALNESETEAVNVLCATNEDPLLKEIPKYFELAEEKVPAMKRLLSNDNEDERDGSNYHRGTPRPWSVPRDSRGERSYGI
ncbi:uncharacterized protein LOC129765697 [Toxorhynchites rutilus septentrionalis]|uniref:uncharacterized protein LOC129765697 n=1 Tax=Toxorhynchites rutilus septentrionalis TaxID=329112 RepID=UPI00247A5315|nr:uncharacterized protein LOC129765697 [Toxorhynchites rutilus septentrionalis]